MLITIYKTELLYVRKHTNKHFLVRWWNYIRFIPTNNDCLLHIQKSPQIKISTKLKHPYTKAFDIKTSLLRFIIKLVYFINQSLSSLIFPFTSLFPFLLVIYVGVELVYRFYLGPSNPKPTIISLTKFTDYNKK